MRARGLHKGEKIMNEMTTKAQVRSDFKYAREMMRQAEVAMKSNDIEELSVIAHEFMACSSTLFQYMEERGGAV
jgi:hypothetical protein